MERGGEPAGALVAWDGRPGLQTIRGIEVERGRDEGLAGSGERSKDFGGSVLASCSARAI